MLPCPVPRYPRDVSQQPTITLPSPPSLQAMSMDPSSVDFRAFYPHTPNEVKHRKRSTMVQLRTLEAVFKRDTKPNGPLRVELATQLGMTPRGVQVWFQNRRAKEKSNARRVQTVPQSNSSETQNLLLPPNLQLRGESTMSEWAAIPVNPRFLLADIDSHAYNQGSPFVNPFPLLNPSSSITTNPDLPHTLLSPPPQTENDAINDRRVIPQTPLSRTSHAQPRRTTPSAFTPNCLDVSGASYYTHLSCIPDPLPTPDSSFGTAGVPSMTFGGSRDGLYNFSSFPQYVGGPEENHNCLTERTSVESNTESTRIGSVTSVRMGSDTESIRMGSVVSVGMGSDMESVRMGSVTSIEAGSDTEGSRMGRLESQTMEMKVGNEMNIDDAGKQHKMLHAWGLSVDPCSTDPATLFKLATVFEDMSLYKKFLLCSEGDAQTIIDVLQLLLDTQSLEDSRRRQVITAMRRLSERTGLFPSCFELHLNSVEVLEDQCTKSGGYADIYMARFKDENLCLKVIRTYKSSLVEHMAKIYAREVILWGQLSHPNLLPFYGLYSFRSRISFVSPWADNGHLGDYLERNNPANRLLLCSDTAAGISYLHDNAIVHGDIKAANVLVDRSGRACLADFGLSSVTDPQILHWASHSSVASKGGSIRWQAPELHALESDDAEGEKIVHNSKESDVFAWACLCYEVFTGQVPYFESTRNSTVILKISRGDHPTRPPDDTDPWTRLGLTTTLWDMMENCWNFQPLERPNISTVVSRLELLTPEDTRTPSSWQERSAMRFRNVQCDYPDPHRLTDLDMILSRLL